MTDQYDHRMQSNETARKKSSQAHPAPAIIIRVTDDKSGKQEKEIYRKIAVIDNLAQWAGGMPPPIWETLTTIIDRYAA